MNRQEQSNGKIYIKNEKETYSPWVIDEYVEDKQYYRISLLSDRSIISAISNKKIYLNNGKKYCDEIKNIKSSFNFAFAAFKTINLG